MDGSTLADDNQSLFYQDSPIKIAQSVCCILKDPISWLSAHSTLDYLDMVKVKYRTFVLEYPGCESIGKLPSLFSDEFGSEVSKYVTLVDRHGNQFDVIVERQNNTLCFTHGWSDIRKCYMDSDVKGCWATVTYIRPRLFVLLLKDRYYRDLMTKHSFPATRLRLSRDVFGPESAPGWAGRICMPYEHPAENFCHSFIVILTHSDVTSGFLDLDYGHAAREMMSDDLVYVRLIDEKGFKWFCTVDVDTHSYRRLKLAGKWKSMLRIRNYEAGNHLMFGKPAIGDDRSVFVKKIY